jgi:ferric-dicitrate binding protein FerR (iron transport regulator)
MMALSTMNLFGLVAFGSSKNPVPRQSAMIKTDGIVTINGTRATSGQTVFSGSSITTEMQSESLINLDNQARLKLNEATALTLAFSRFGLTGSLSDGQVNTSVPAGFRAEIKTADASVITSPAEPATFSIRVDACSTNLSVQTGQVEVRAWNRVHSVRAGESFSTAEVFPAAPQQNLSQRKRLGLFVGIGAAVGVLLIVLTGHHDQPQTENFGGCVIILSPGGPNTCP